MNTKNLIRKIEEAQDLLQYATESIDDSKWEQAQCELEDAIEVISAVLISAEKAEYGEVEDE